MLLKITKQNMPCCATTFIFLLLNLVVKSNGYSSGAPAIVCSTRVPRHSNQQPQITSSPYKIEANPINGSFEVTITSSQSFKGFLLRARSENGGNNEFIGQFSTTMISKHVCGEGNVQGLTHTDSSDKTNQTFVWQPPNNFCGNIVFEATVVQSFTTFWVGVTSSPLTINCTLMNTTVTNESTGAIMNATTNAMLNSSTISVTTTTMINATTDKSTTSTLMTSTMTGSVATTPSSTSAQNNAMDRSLQVLYVLQTFVMVLMALM